jgi:Zn-dependent peptidase ImmA (M78 family)
MPELTPARAGGFLTTAGGCWSELLKDNTALDGLLVARASGSYIFVRADASNPVSRRRFTAAHELGHYLLHFRPSLESQREPDAPFVRTDDEKTLYEGEENKVDKVQSPPEWERQANRFAAELLMPEAVCRSAHENYVKRLRAPVRFLEHHLAADLLVSQKAVQVRLRELRLTN